MLAPLFYFLLFSFEQAVRNWIAVEESAQGERQRRRPQQFERARYGDGHRRQQQQQQPGNNGMRRSLQALSHVQHSGQ